MGKSPQLSAKIRKSPKQDRSKATIEAILDATLQLLNNGTISSISTNHIAERAGVSIGTLYQYFPNKTAAFVAVAERRRAATAKTVIDQLAKMNAKTLEEANRQIIRILMKSVSNSHRERQLTMLTTMLRLEGQSHARPVNDVTTVIAGIIGEVLDVQKPESKIASFVLTRAVTGTIQAALVDAPHLIKEPEFEDQLVRLSMSFLQAQ